MRIAYLVALVTVANVLSAPNGYAGNSSVTVQIGANNTATSTQSGGSINLGLIVQAGTGSTNSATINQNGAKNTSGNGGINILFCLNGSCP